MLAPYEMRQPPSAAVSEQVRQMTTSYKVPDVSCDHCVRAIVAELAPIVGVREVDVDLSGKMVTVEHDASVTDAQLRAGIEAAGYDVAA